jgi:hypothetical protein
MLASASLKIQEKFKSGKLQYVILVFSFENCTWRFG